MNKNKNIFAVILLVYALLSCVEDKDCSRENSSLDINATIHNTVIAKQTFIQDDCIGVYLVAYNNGVPGLLGDINLTHAANVEYAFDDSGYWFSKNGTDLFLSDELSDLYAYHPYDEEMGREPGKTNLTAYPFTVDADQQTAGGEASDFLWAKVPGLSTTNYTAPIVFKHLMCRCEINIRLAEGIEVSGIPLLEVHNTRSSSTINLRNGQVTPTGTPQTIIPERNMVVTPGYDFTYDAILVPQTLDNGLMFLSIQLDGETFVFSLPAEITFESQQCYLFNLVAGHSPLRSSGEKIMELLTENI